MQPKLDKFSPTGKCFRHLFQLEFELRSQLDRERHASAAFALTDAQWR